MSVSATSAAGTLSPDLKVFSSVRPVNRFRYFVRTKAWPFPGFSSSLDTMLHSSVEEDFKTPFEFIGTVGAHAAIPCMRSIDNEEYFIG